MPLSWNKSSHPTPHQTNTDGSPVVAFFWADWHEPSKPQGQMDSVFTHLAALHPGLRCLRVEAEAVPEVSVLFSIAVVPTFVFLRGGKVTDKLEGAHPAELAKKLQALTAASASLPPPSAGSSSSTTTTAHAHGSGSSTGADGGNLEGRLKRLITQAPVVVFMKGSPSNPRCGFSRSLVELLKLEGITFASFDILEDEEVRQGLKAYSDWKTYPQLYVNGELVGGLDIVKEMVTEAGASGRLKEELGIKDLPPASSSDAGAGDGAGAGDESLETRLTQLINKAPVMVFMKGTPAAAKCGFSSQLVALLQGQGVAFDSFDILEDEEVRQGLKKFSQWPTYPQLYANGELVGGLDIVKELHENGELEAALQG